MNKVVAEFSDKAALEFYDAEFILVSGRRLQFLKPGNYMLSSVLKGNINTPDISVCLFSFNSPLGKPNVGAFYGHSTMVYAEILDTRVHGSVHTLHFDNFIHLSITALDTVKQAIISEETIKALWSQPYVDPLIEAKKEHYLQIDDLSITSVGREIIGYDKTVDEEGFDVFCLRLKK